MSTAKFNVDKIAPVESKLTEILAVTSDVEQARVIAHEFLDNCAMPKSVAAKRRELDGMTSLVKINNLCYNTMLSGEGLAVAK